MRRRSPALLPVWAESREGALIRARIVLLIVVVLLVVAGCSSNDGEGSGAMSTTSAAADTATTVAETTTTVADGEAGLAVRYTDSGTASVGDRQFIEGTVTIRLSNETDSEAIVVLLRYETGSAALAEELEIVEEGGRLVTGELPTAGYEEIDLEGSGTLMPGNHTWTVDLAPGTYLFDVGPLDFHTTGLWRAAVFEVVSVASPDVGAVEQLVDAHNLAWVDHEPEGVGAVFTDGGVLVDLAGVEIVGKDEIVAYAKGHVGLVTESRRTGPIKVHEEGIFLVPTELVVTGRGTYTGIVAVTIDGDLFARYEWHEGPTRQ